MFKALLNLFRVPDLRKKLIFTLVVIIVYRLGAQIAVPGVNIIKLHGFNAGGGGSLADFLNLFSGGTRENASVFSLGVMPYITAVIIMELLKAVVPSIDKMIKEGPEGRKKFQQYGRYLTVPTTLFQAYIFARGLINQNISGGFLTISPSLFLIIATLSITAGTLILMWMGEQIAERGIGNGISIIIMSGIIARLPSAVFRMVNGVSKGSSDPMTMLIVLVLFFLVIGLVVFEEKGLRKIPIQYANRAVSGTSHGGQVHYLPFKVNPTGVIPIIFASSLLLVPAQIGAWFGGKIKFLSIFQQYFSSGQLAYNITYFILIIFFAYFYTDIQYNQHDIAENLRKQGGFIPGVRPGQKTEEFLSFTLSRITLPGSVFLGIIALIPTIVIQNLNIPAALGYLMGGTSLLIMVGVALDTLKQIESHLMMHHLDGFLSKSSK